MKYNVFSNAVRLDTPPEAEHATPIEASEIVEEIFPLIKEDREYLGIVDSLGTTLQLLYDAEEDRYWVEVPCPAEQGSYGAWLDFAHTHSLLKTLPVTIPVEGFPGFEFQSWG